MVRSFGRRQVMISDKGMKERSSSVFLVFATFIILTVFVAKQITRPFDLMVTQWIQQWASEPLDIVLYFFTILGSIEFSCFALLVICWYFYRKYQWPGVFLYLFFFMLLSGVEFLWKYIVAYTGPGPEFDRNPFHWALIAVRAPYAFPSGHTFRSIFLLGIWYQRLHSKFLPQKERIRLHKLVILFLAFGIVYRRIYLGDHWMSDVFGRCLLAVLGLLLASQSPQYELRPA